MKARHLVMFSAASGALIASAPALAQPEMTYEQPYEYAQPAPPPQAPRVVYRQEAVVQPIPAAPPMSEQADYDNGYQDAGADYEVEYEYTDAPQARVPGYSPQVMPHQAVPYPHHAMQMQQQPQFDRGAWLDECVSRYNGGEVRRDRNGNIIGGFVGAAAGGLIGNRVAGRGDRLAGSLIG
ncbi:MAG: hypothetical protein WAT93_06455, partial [Pontixanthobacter sp.]